MDRISEGQQLNDRVINAFPSLISNEKTLILDTSNSVHIKNENIRNINRWFLKKLRVLLPIHWKSPGHWSLALLDKRLARTMLFDSLVLLRLFEGMLEEVRSWEEQAKDEIKLNEDWPEVLCGDLSSTYSEHHTNGVDCGDLDLP